MGRGRKKITAEKDWRNLPRKDTEYRDRRITIRLTETEYRGIEILARKAGVTMGDLMVCRALRKEHRIPPV